jgi:hypothetical protein
VFAHRKEVRNVSETVAEPTVRLWKNVGSAKRRQRVLDSLAVRVRPEGAPPTQYYRISGHSMAYIYARLFPAVFLLLVELTLYLKLANGIEVPRMRRRAMHRALHNSDGSPDKPVFGSRHVDVTPLANLVGLLTILTLLVAALYIGYALIRWWGMFVVLSNYGLKRVWAYPSIFFWFDKDTEELPQHNISHLGYDRPWWVKMLGRYGTFGYLALDSPGEGDDKHFNRVPLVPDVEEFYGEVAAVYNALSPALVSETDRLVAALGRIQHEQTTRLIRALGGREDVAEDPTKDSQATQEMPPTD